MRLLRILLTGMLAVISFSALAQTPGNISLTLTDENTGEPVGYATVSVSKAGETKALKYALTDENGKAVIEKVRNGNYVIKAELLGYKAYEKTVKVEGDLNLGTIKMALDQQMLDAAKVTGIGNPIIIKKDTVEYNASSFKTTDNDMLEDLLKKLPGVEVESDGTVKANGKTIEKITIGGKTFFLNDPQLATKNLPANMIEKIKVVQKKSEQAEFTGIDDGEETTVLDLSVRPGMMNGLFGNVTAGGGHDIPQAGYYNDEVTWKNDGWRYQGAAFAGKFTDKSQISVVLNANNNNNRSFNDLAGSMMAGMRGGGMGRGMNFFGTGNGITTSWMGGINGAWDLFDDKMNLGGNYVYNGSSRYVEEESIRNTYLEDGSTLDYWEKGTNSTDSYGNRFGMRLEHKFSEKTSILFEPSLDFGHGNFREFSEFDTKKNGTINTNDGFTNNTGDNSNLSTSGRFLLRQRLGIPGRTLTVRVRYSFSNNTTDGLNQSLTNNYGQDADNQTTSDIINQRFHQNQKSTSVRGTFTYTEPLGRNFYVEGNYSYNWSRSTSDKLTYDSGAGYGIDGRSMGYIIAGETLNGSYSNSILNKGISQNIGTNLLYQDKKLSAQVGVGVVPTITDNVTNGNTYHDRVVNISPRARVMYDINDYENIRIFYRGNSSQPSTSQLMPVLDNSNPLRMTFGNPYLSPYFSHSLRAEFNYMNRATFTSFHAGADGSMTQNPIINASWYGTNGATYSLPVNGPTSASINIRSFLNSPIAKSNFSISNMLFTSYGSNYSYVGSTFDSSPYITTDPISGAITDFDYDRFHDDFPELGKKDYDAFTLNHTQSWSLTERMNVTYRNDLLEIRAGGATNTNKSWYTIASKSTNRTWNNTVNGSVNWTVGKTGLTIQSDMNYKWYKGYATQQDPEYIWNANISMQVFKNQATISLRAFDILNQAKNLSVSDTANYHVESRNNTLGRYVLLSFTWKFGTFSGRGGRGRGGFGGRGGYGGGRRPSFF
ncbi:MAG: outer membrane beta-barrel protein [Bacteroidales bacterium]|nr:outer membrane beta-barrel protein [Bacteroidales bacterium]MBR4817147.1 outer membrane beta-barrel protein [Bacteroidales bacterium]